MDSSPLHLICGAKNYQEIDRRMGLSIDKSRDPLFYFLTVTHVPISSRHHLTLKLDNRDRRRWRERERQKVLDPFFGRLLLLDLMEINVREILHRLAIQILRKRVL